MTIMLFRPFVAPGKMICTGSDDATMRIWNPRSGENIHVVRGMLETWVKIELVKMLYTREIKIEILTLILEFDCQSF